MRKRLLIVVNALLVGALTLLLASCHTQKKAVENENTTVEPDTVMPPPHVVVKYGVPPLLR